MNKTNKQPFELAGKLEKDIKEEKSIIKCNQKTKF